MRYDKRDFEVILLIQLYGWIQFLNDLGKILVNGMRLQLGVCSFIIHFNPEGKSILSILLHKI